MYLQNLSLDGKPFEIENQTENSVLIIEYVLFCVFKIVYSDNILM